jgi:hypothetical protein
MDTLFVFEDRKDILIYKSILIDRFRFVDPDDEYENMCSHDVYGDVAIYFDTPEDAETFFKGYVYFKEVKGHLYTCLNFLRDLKEYACFAGLDYIPATSVSERGVINNDWHFCVDSKGIWKNLE